MRGGIAAALGVLALGGASAVAADEQRRASAVAEAFAREGESGALAGSVRASGNEQRAGNGTSASASTAGGKGRARAAADLSDVEMFDGLVTARRVTVAAEAAAGRTSTSGRVTALRIDGRLVTPPRGRTEYDMGGVGRLVALASGRTGILGLRGWVTQDYKGWKAGDTLTVGYASARASDAAAPAATERPEPQSAQPAAKAGKKARRPRSAAERRRVAAERRRLKQATDELLARRGYAFPVGGEPSFSDDYGAPRATIASGSHEGNDIFAPMGTPIVAVADGRIYRVGTRKVSGNRLWLRDRAGYRFFYAHLADFAAAAFNGADVRAGEVIGYVGNTGDAEPTPPHLHFEVHLPDGTAINPFPVITAWQQRADVRPGAAAAGPPPGALVVVKDFLAVRP